MAEYSFYTHPMSRGQIARWALHEVDADHDTVLVDWLNKPQALLDANPMGKLPTLIHHHGGRDYVVTEAAAICHYLALRHPDRGLAPREDEWADYYRWMFFAAGPVEAAATANALGFDPANDPKKQAMAGFGSLERTVNALEHWLKRHDYICGSRFTMADVYVGSQVDWGLQFKSLPARDALSAYAERIRRREAYQAAKAIDAALIAEMHAKT